MVPSPLNPSIHIFFFLSDFSLKDPQPLSLLVHRPSSSPDDRTQQQPCSLLHLFQLASNTPQSHPSCLYWLASSGIRTVATRPTIVSTTQEWRASNNSPHTAAPMPRKHPPSPPYRSLQAPTDPFASTTTTSAKSAIWRRKEQQTGKKERREANLKTVKQKLKSIVLLWFYLLLQVTVFLTTNKEGKGRRSWAKSSTFHFLLAAARETMCRQWWWRVEKMRHHCACSSRRLPSTVMDFRGLFCNF